jgi:hypothetical protein
VSERHRRSQRLAHPPGCTRQGGERVPPQQRRSIAREWSVVRADNGLGGGGGLGGERRAARNAQEHAQLGRLPGRVVELRPFLVHDEDRKQQRSRELRPLCLLVGGVLEEVKELGVLVHLLPPQLRVPVRVRVLAAPRDLQEQDHPALVLVVVAPDQDICASPGQQRGGVVRKLSVLVVAGLSTLPAASSKSARAGFGRAFLLLPTAAWRLWCAFRALPLLPFRAFVRSLWLDRPRSPLGELRQSVSRLRLRRLRRSPRRRPNGTDGGWGNC